MHLGEVPRKMVDRRIIGAFGIACAIALGGTTQASASPLLGIELEETGYSSSSTTSAGDPLIIAQNFGTFALNIEMNNLVTNPLSIDLSSLNITTNSAGTLTIIASATGLTSPLGLEQFSSELSGAFADLPPGGVSSVTMQSFISDTDTMFGTNTSLASLSGIGNPFSASGTGSATTTDPFAITEVVTIRAAGPAVVGLNAVTAAVTVEAPEIDASAGLAAIALLLGVLGLAGERRRRPAATA